ncbi:30S ribosomal protein S27e [Candidatus Pacearchaeota archaeon]|nr:30S ribosomal protein S27e [Candidatus Pacearchaeota archaeon]
MIENKKGRFLEIVCPRCKNAQIVFGKSATRIKCVRCNKLLTKVTGGKTKIKAMVKKVL